MKNKNILLIGATKSGKSTLANVLTQTNEFKEGWHSCSQTKEVKIAEFKNQEGEVYQLIDVMGFGDTATSQEESLYSLAEIGYAIRNGLNRVLLTIGQSSPMKVESPEKASYDWLEKLVFGEKFTDYVTVVKTHFENFENEKACKEDMKRRKINSYAGEIIYIDNPRIDALSEIGRKKKKNNEESRELSRQVVLKHLKKYEDKFFHPENLKDLNDSIGEEMEEIWEDKSIIEDETEYKYRKKMVVKKFIEFIRDRGGIRLDIGYDFWEKLNKTEKRLEKEIETLKAEREAKFKQLRIENQEKATDKDKLKESEKKVFQPDSSLKEWIKVKIEEIKQQKNKWIIEKVVTSSGQVYDNKNKKKLKYSEQEKEDLLIHYEDLANLTYCENNGRLIFSERMFLKQVLGNEKWNEIKQVLNDWTTEEDRKEVYQYYDSTWKKIQGKVKLESWETEKGIKKWMIQLRKKKASIEKWQEREKETIIKKIHSEKDNWIITISEALNFESKEELIVHVSNVNNKEVSAVEYGKIYQKSFFSDKEWEQIKVFFLQNRSLIQQQLIKK